MEAAGFQGVTVGADPDEHYLNIDTRSPLNQEKVFLCAWVLKDGSIREVLSFVFPNKNGQALMGLHLNNWRRPLGEHTVPHLVDLLWEAFWKHEEENHTLGRIQWMRSPRLPPLTEIEYLEAPLLAQEAPTLDALDELLAEVNTPGPPPTPRSKKKPLLDEGSVLDLFKG